MSSPAAGGGDAYWDLYRVLDVCLDTHPYGGHTTTFDALWMGVPVITLAGPTRLSREGLAILRTLGLPELVAGSVDAYVDAAVALGRSAERVAVLRAGLRQRLRESPFADGRALARRVESAYCRLWEAACRDRGHM